MGPLRPSPYLAPGSAAHYRTAHHCLHDEVGVFVENCGIERVDPVHRHADGTSQKKMDGGADGDLHEEFGTTGLDAVRNVALLIAPNRTP